MKIKAISDTHTFHMEEGRQEVDLLIHAGDAADSNSLLTNEVEFREFWDWWETYPAKYKVFVPGNHDLYMESPMSKSLRKKHKGQNNSWILIDQTAEIEGIKIFGSPYTPEFSTGWAFNSRRDKLHKRWGMIDPGVDIIVTHGPPRYILDHVPRGGNMLESVGCSALAKRIAEVRPKYSIFGHVHDNTKFKNQGVCIKNGITYINASQVKDNNFDFGLTNKGIVFNYGEFL